MAGLGVVRTSIAIALAAAVAACSKEPPPPAPAVRPIKIFEVADAGAGTVREFPGEISAAHNDDIAFEVSGKIIEFPVKESQRVERGQVLARLDPRNFQADLDAASAQTGAMKADVSRYRAMFKEDVASKQDLERAERNYEVSRAREASARKALEDTVLRAPFAGVVARKLVGDFANVKAKDPVLKLQTGGDLDIVVNFPEKDYTRLRPGQTVEEINQRIRAEVVVSALPGRKLPARLKEFATTADPVTRTFPATFSFDAPSDVNVMPGMTAKLVLQGNGRPSGAVLVPVQCTAEDEGRKPYVWQVDPKTMHVSKTYVTLGSLTGDSVEVTSGLSPGAWVAASGVHQLREGMEVRRAGS